MKKTIKVMAFAVTMLLCGAAQAEDWLWWMIDQSAEQEQVTFDYAKIKLVGSDPGEFLAVAGDAPNTEFWSLDGKGLEAFAVYTGSATTSSYVIELYLNDSLYALSSQEYSYADMAEYIFDKSSIPLSMTPLTVSGFHVVPEPTGGLLVLFGLACLGLRRKEVFA